MKTLSIYVHIPFCVKKCNYCDFLSGVADGQKREEYMQSLLKEIEAESVKYKDYSVMSVYIGGGTPSVVLPERIRDVMETVRASYRLEEDAEISIEVNPGTVDKEALSVYRAAGINRLSIGLQSADNRELRLLGRVHTYEDFLQTYKYAWEAGFTNINIDIMSALPGQTLEDYGETLKRMLTLRPRPSHFSAYGLIVEEGTPFYELYGREKAQLVKTGEEQEHLPSEEEERKMYELTRQIFQTAGYQRYEISNYSYPGRECRHNLVYWKRGNYAGFGLGASSLVENTRFRNVSILKEYLERDCKIAEETCLSQKEQMEEFMFLGLRMIQGVQKEVFEKEFGIAMDEVYGKVLEENVKQGLLTDGASVALTDKGLDVANYVMAQFLL